MSSSVVQQTGATSASIRSEPAFKAMRGCARECLAWNNNGDLYSLFDCEYPQQNECLCRTDLASAASKHLSTCCSSLCTPGPATGDIVTAISVYNSTQLGPTATQGNGASTGSTPPAADKPDPTGSTNNSDEAGTTSSNNNNPGGSNSGGGGGGGGLNLSTGTMVAIIAPIVSVVIALVGLGVKIHYNRKKVKQGKQLTGQSSVENLKQSGYSKK
ncbi:hypothetical protein QBC35DRAFT_541629 [Podospora australis]|uniref:Extracellular membrane protein CFEM domain-containing protein n=1 Tax=Podospora australis TaxID=1536484 RepID=A0AAN6WM93_9PEZI|nr:hypothetical protein QBC35DRAFT_541629 [Podospora australis]